jgi:hypothetical protein
MNSDATGGRRVAPHSARAFGDLGHGSEIVCGHALSEFGCG